ncbi:unnamed protein product, partial [Chrysoparadoxa australica]
LFLLLYCSADLVNSKHASASIFKEVIGLPFLPLADGTLARIEGPEAAPKLLGTREELLLLAQEGAGCHMIDDLSKLGHRLGAFLNDR